MSIEILNFLNNLGCLTNHDCCSGEICSPKFKCMKKFECSQDDLRNAHADVSLDKNYSTSLGSKISIECINGPESIKKIDVKCTESGWIQTNGARIQKCVSASQDCGQDETYDSKTMKCLKSCKPISSNQTELDIESCCRNTKAPERCVQKCLGLEGNDPLDDTECVSYINQFWHCQELQKLEYSAEKEFECSSGFKCKDDGFCHPYKMFDE